MTAEDTRSRVERMVEADPRLSAAQIARAIGVTRQRVHRIIKELGYGQAWQRPSERPKKKGRKPRE